MEAQLVEAAFDGGSLVAAVLNDVDADGLLQVSDRVKAKLSPAVVVLG